MKIPDFTKGNVLPAGAKHDWNLGTTGARGWMFCDQIVTADARQVVVTKVDKGSPADGVFRVGDVILGVGGKPFSYDPRTEFGKALTTAESEACGGKLTLTRWRAGKTDPVVVKPDNAGFDQATEMLKSELDAARPVVVDFKYIGPQFPNGSAGHTLNICGYIAAEIYGLTSDTDVRSDGVVSAASGSTVLPVGSGSPALDRSAVFAQSGGGGESLHDGDFPV